VTKVIIDDASRYPLIEANPLDVTAAIDEWPDVRAG
jgi:hypothetical protein